MRDKSMQVARGLRSENFGFIVSEESLPSSIKTLSGSFGEVHSSQALRKIYLKETKIFIVKA